MPVDEFVRWCAYIRMQNQPNTAASSGGGKIAAFRRKLAKTGYYKNTGYRK